MANVVKKHNISSELAQKMVDEVVAKVAGMSCSRGAFLWQLISEWTKDSGPMIKTLISADLSRSLVFAIVLALLHRLFQFLLVAGKESMNLAMRFGADSVNLRIKLLPRGFRIFIEQCLNLIVVLI
jgi:hypothetical protein